MQHATEIGVATHACLHTAESSIQSGPPSDPTPHFSVHWPTAPKQKCHWVDFTLGLVHGAGAICSPRCCEAGRGVGQKHYSAVLCCPLLVPLCAWLCCPACYSPTRARQLASLSVSDSAAPVRPSARGRAARLASQPPPAANGELDASASPTATTHHGAGQQRVGGFLTAQVLGWNDCPVATSKRLCCALSGFLLAPVAWRGPAPALCWLMVLSWWCGWTHPAVTSGFDLGL